MATVTDAHLEQFVEQGKSAAGRAAADLIQQATSAPGLFAFGELLDLDNVKALEGGELAPHVALLRLFAYGTLAEYRASAAGLPPLNPAQELKLKKLTVATLAEDSKVLSYDLLMAQLEVPTVRELEDLLINECMATGLVRGKLDQRERCFEVHNAVGRDIKPGQLKNLIATLSDWHANAKDVLAGVEEKMAWAQQAQEDTKRHKEAVEARMEAVKKTVKTDVDAAGRQEGLFHVSEAEDGREDMMDEDMRSGIGSKRRR
mmetsp:Transcript_32846/g.52633  ORF Transcript_32846/g.52633 Transcript_32846/m.52633 type:complete len:260 (-) Transcript_32846:76-855(-)